MAADISIHPLTTDVGREVALASLLSKSRGVFEYKYKSFPNATPEELSSAEALLMELYSEDDRFGNYHIAIIDSAPQTLNANQSKTTFLKNPSRTDWSYYILGETKVGFAKHVINEKRFERTITDTEGNERPISQIEQRDVLIYCEAEIFKFADKHILLIKLPWYRRKLSQTYDFSEEISYISNWASQNLQVRLVPFPLKKFFEAFKPHSFFDKSEFYVKGLPSAQGVYPMDMKVGSDLNGLTSAYANLDKVLSTTMSTSMAEKFSEYIRKSDLTDQEKVIALATNFFKSQGISSQEFFEVLHQTFEQGLGRITYTKFQEFLHYKLDYTEQIPGLIRASKLGWDVFEHLWGEIKKYLT